MAGPALPGKSEDACNNSIKWVKLLVMFSIQHLYELRRNFKIPAGQESSWSDFNGFSGAERRDTSITEPSRGLTPVAAVGPEALVEPAKGEMNVAKLQTLLDRIFDDGNRMGIDSYSRDTMNISFAIGFALNGMQDSYTARHAERQNFYAGSIARLYPWDNARDATLIGLFPEHPTVAESPMQSPICGQLFATLDGMPSLCQFHDLGTSVEICVNQVRA